MNTWPRGPNGEPLSGREQREALHQSTTELLRDKNPPLPSISKCRRTRKAGRSASRAERRSLLKLDAPILQATEGNCCIYVIGRRGYPVKIGMAVDVEKRISELQTGFPYRLDVFATVEVRAAHARKIEKACHDRLHSRRRKGEWFQIEPAEAAAVVRSIAQAWRDAGYA